jgi:hypothetical protein
MPAIDDLAGLRRACRDGIRIYPRAVATDHLDAGVLFQPGRDGRLAVVRQQGNRLSQRQVNDNGAHRLSFAP